MPQKTMIRTCYFFKASNKNWVSFNLMLPERGFWLFSEFKVPLMNQTNIGLLDNPP